MGTRNHGHRHERGMVLVVALVFLLLLTLIGVTAMSTTSLEEKMAGNAKDRNLAFQSAEAALVLAENWADSQLQMPPFPDNAKGLYVPAASTDPVAVWDSINWNAANVSVSYPCTPSQLTGCASGVAAVKTQPKFIIEELTKVSDDGGSLGIGQGYSSGGAGQSTVYRITARGTGGTDAAQVLLQSTFKRP